MGLKFTKLMDMWNAHHVTYERIYLTLLKSVIDSTFTRIGRSFDEEFWRCFTKELNNKIRAELSVASTFKDLSTIEVVASSSSMDDVDGDDINAVNASEDGQSHGKETYFLLKTESHSMLKTQEIDISREGNYEESSIQEFMDYLDGNKKIKGVGDRVQELTLDNYSLVLALRSDNEQTQDKWHT